MREDDGVYGDLDRPPLSASVLTRALEPDGWQVEVLAETGSTNAVVGDRARAGTPQGLVVVAESQTAGRGRLDRTWVSPPRAGLTFSALLRPGLPPVDLPWVPLLSGVAVARALREHTGVDAVLKWPNDVLVDGRKLCGLLAEVPVEGAVVVGIGLNVTTRAEELPHEQATSLQLEGAEVLDRDTLLRAVLRSLTDVLALLRDDRAAAFSAYRALCSTLGTEVRVERPDGDSGTGVAEQVDDLGRLVVAGVAHSAGDVVHVRRP
ncbi:MAG: biotin--[acetyl-CoA-carboxylase] ligase [Mycobacteriales bacterium]|nr:biotin--[acetyl-CoA-carboxylase] ligase [Mycobacteriales bacterium]